MIEHKTTDRIQHSKWLMTTLSRCASKPKAYIGSVESYPPPHVVSVVKWRKFFHFIQASRRHWFCRPFSMRTRLFQYQNVSNLNFTGAKDDGGGGDNWSYKTCKQLQSSSQTVILWQDTYRNWFKLINNFLHINNQTKYQNHMTFSFLVITALRCHLKLKVKPVRYLPEAQLPADHVTGCVVKQIIADRSPGVIVQHFHTSNERALTSFQPDVITHCTCTHVHFYTR